LGNKLGYWNTDIFGFCKALKEDLKFDNKDKNVLLIGCGGTGRAIIAGLSWKKQYTRKIYIYENNEQVVRSAQKYFFQDLSSQFSFLKQKLEFISIGQIPQVIKKCQLLVNATPIGMESDEGSAIDKNLLEENKHLSVYDVVYNRETRLIKDAKSLELPARGGLGMLLYQGARSFEIWTGKEAPIEIMRQALNKEVNKL
jgi:shikimate dehydrogenase